MSYKNVLFGQGIFIDTSSTKRQFLNREDDSNRNDLRQSDHT
jgi:hypothetical protein